MLNVHSLHHLVDYARHHGPLWTWWAFPFEDKNRYLSEVTHASRLPAKQIFSAINLLSSLPLLANRLSGLQATPRDEQV